MAFRRNSIDAFGDGSFGERRVCRRSATLLLALAMAVALFCGCAADGVGSSLVSGPDVGWAFPAESEAPAAHSGGAPAAAGEGRYPAYEGTVLLEVPAPSLAHNLLGDGDTRFIGAVLPPGYGDEDALYPVVYYLTGYSESYELRTQFFGGLMERLYAADALPPMIVVVVQGQNRLQGGWYTNSPVTGNWEDYITAELIAFVEENLRAIPGAEGRGLVGHSMGGAGVLNIAARHPGLYSGVYAISPAVFEEGGLESFDPGLALIEEFAARYEGMDQESAHARFMEDLVTLESRYYWPFAYGMAFGGDAQALPPYIRLPERDEAGGWRHDDPAWQALENGEGGWAQKAAEYKDNLMQLNGRLVIDYGTADELPFIPPGCEYVSQQLTAQGIAHTLDAYEGTHDSHVDGRIESIILPWFAEGFA